MLRKIMVSIILILLILISQSYTYANNDLTLRDLGIADRDIKNMSDEKRIFIAI